MIYLGKDPIGVNKFNNNEPHNYAFDGLDLSKVFVDADALQAALAAEDYENIHVGDYWPVTLNGTYRDYGNMTVPAGTTYYSDEAMTAVAGTTSEAIIPSLNSDANFVGCHKPFNTIKISNVNYYVPWDDCLDYQERTLSNAIMKFEVAGINQYWRYGDSGTITGNKPHILFAARDCIPHTLKMRKCDETWEGQHIDEFTGDGTTAKFTLSGTAGTIGYVWVAGARKTYNTHYTFDSNKVTFKAGQIPASGAKIQIEWCEDKTPWRGSAMYRTLNDPDYGLLPLLQAADPKLMAHIYTGPNGEGMRYYGETRAKTGAQGGAWEDRGPLFLPLEDEGWGRFCWHSGSSAASNMQQWALYRSGRRHFSKGIGNGASRTNWWLASSNSATYFTYVESNGRPGYLNATFAFGAAPAFILA